MTVDRPTTSESLHELVRAEADRDRPNPEAAARLWLRIERRAEPRTPGRKATRTIGAPKVPRHRQRRVRLAWAGLGALLGLATLVRTYSCRIDETNPERTANMPAVPTRAIGSVPCTGVMDEAMRLDRVQDELRTQHVAGARALLTDYRRACKNPRLVEPAESLDIFVACAEGETARAQKQAAAFARAWPSSHQLEALDAGCRP